MLKHALPVWFIAERLGCSERTVRRYLKHHFCEASARRRTWVRENSERLRSGQEVEMWQHYRTAGYTYETIGLLFGRSKQAIQKALTT